MKATKLKNLPNLLSLSNMAIGLLVICSMTNKNSLIDQSLACYLIYLAVMLDLFDGYLARHLNAVSDMGKQLDSFADLITFGLAPIIIFVSNISYLPWYMKAILLLYPLAGVIRLARYNLQDKCEYFMGLPITASGFIMVTALNIYRRVHNEFIEEFIIFYVLLALTLSIMMVSKIRVKRILKK